VDIFKHLLLIVFKKCNKKKSFKLHFLSKLGKKLMAYKQEGILKALWSKDFARKKVLTIF
jgi:hypothetical protein